MDESMIQGLAQQAEKLKVGEGSLGKCAQMQKCDFSDLGSETLASCVSASDSVYTLTVALEEGAYKIKCSTGTSAEYQRFGLSFNGTKKEVTSYNAAIPPNSCIFQ